VASWLLAWVVGRGWGGSFAPSVDVILVPAAVAVAACIGLGVSAFETDLVGHRFGWRQLVTALMVSAAVVGLLPVLAEAGNGRFGLPSTGLDTPLQFLGSPGGTGAYRVLWLGAPQALPLGGWSSEPGLAYATSDGLPDATYLFAPAGPGPASTLATDVSLAQQGRTVHLGRLLAPASIRYVVVLGTLAPSITGLQSPANYPLPPGLLTALSDQTDLRQVPGGEGFSVFDNTDFIPQRAERSSAQPLPASGTLNPSASEVTGWHQIMTGQSSALSFSGTIAGGSVFTSYAPAGEWKLISKGTTLSARPAFGWAAQYRNVPAGTAQLAFDGTPLVPVGMLLELALWLFVAWVMLIRRFGIDRWVRERRRRTSV